MRSIFDEGAPILLVTHDSDDGAWQFHEREYYRLTAELGKARNESKLPDEPQNRSALNDLLIRLRPRDS
jgi:hypothetical protein